MLADFHLARPVLSDSSDEALHPSRLRGREHGFVLAFADFFLPLGVGFLYDFEFRWFGDGWKTKEDD